MSDPVTSITSLISASVGFVNTAMNARDAVKRDEAIGSAYDKLIQTQTQIFPLIEKISLLHAENAELKRKCMELEDNRDKAEQYPLTEVAVGIFARIEKSIEKPIKRRHKLCANCFEKGIYSSLRQDHFTGPQDYWRLFCNECSNTVTFKQFL